ncbi:MAG: DNA-3-methyladenine glycosylase 2 family protein [Chloroflexi bacterium]|nr:DNA-3-methyladenine glycosylase 2 family protein [Chloroflexota bacterium]
MPVTERITRILVPKAPFDFELTAGYHTYFQGRYGTDSLEGGVYRRLLDLDGGLVLASVGSSGTVDSPQLEVELQGRELTDRMADAAADAVGWLLGVDQDLAPFYEMAGQEPNMAGIVQRFRGLHLPHTATVFEALVLGILGQQISTSVARVIRTLLIETHGPRQIFAGVTYYAFPRPETLAAASVEDLRGLKLSWRKAEYVQGIALAALDPDGQNLEDFRGLADDEVVKAATALRGIGTWTAQWLLIRALGRPDGLPLGDLALRRVVSQLYFEGVPVTDAQVEEFCQRWRPWRTYATIYWFTSMRRGMA